MPEFYVEWRIEIEAENAEDAARKALDIQRDRKSSALVFHVFAEGEDFDEEIDLTPKTKKHAS